jgi:Chlorophyll A-B binding protein
MEVFPVMLALSKLLPVLFDILSGIVYCFLTFIDPLCSVPPKLSPFGFAGADKASLLFMREAEVKHSRLAMLAVVGWPIAELFDKTIADALSLPIALTKSGSSPSILNGGLEKIDVLYWVAVITLAGIVEIESSKVQEVKGKDYLPGDCGFDPLNLFPKTKEGSMAMMTKEIKHGRLAMMALVGFVVQEALYRTPVVTETPQFFTPQFL